MLAQDGGSLNFEQPYLTLTASVNMFATR